MNSHSCIKPGCKNTYSDGDPDAYYCPSCNESRKILAAQIDRKLEGHISKRAYSALQEYEASPKIRGFVRVTL